jgi:hypothetical protein
VREKTRVLLTIRTTHRPATGLDKYVNDGPFAASSFLNVAISRVLAVLAPESEPVDPRL